MAEFVASSSDKSDGASESQAFRHLFPEHFYSAFIADGVRPDGRPLGRARAVTVGLGAVGSADGSALVKIGNTTVVAGVRLELGRPEDVSPDQGLLRLSVELAPFSCADIRSPAAQADAATALHRLSDVLDGVLDLHQLAIPNSKSTCWHASLDVYVLDADGSTFDAVLLAAIATLVNAQVPALMISKDGRVRRQADDASTNSDMLDVPASPSGARDASSSTAAAHSFQLSAVPLSLTSCLYKQHVLADPTAEEEGVASCLVTVVLDASGQLRGVFKAGQPERADVMALRQCMEAAKLRYKELAALLQQAQEQAAEPA